MARTQLHLRSVVLLVFIGTCVSIKIKNKLLGKCLQSLTDGGVSLGDCGMSESSLEWRWLPKTHALQSQFTAECLTAPTEQYEGVLLQPCVFTEQTSEDEDELMSRQMWSCSKKGHLTLSGKGLHLSAMQESSLVFVSREHKQGSRWRALDNHTLCDVRLSEHLGEQHILYPGKAVEAGISVVDEQTQSYEDVKYSEATEADPLKNVSLPSVNTKSDVDPTMIFFNMDYGMGWKVTMLVLSSLALVLGTIILILNVYSNRRKKVVCVLKSYSPRQDLSAPGSPLPSERAPLTEHAMRLPHSTPTLQRGEILIEWKDGTVTPLYEA